ncbi:extracellular solute-binding protein [Xylocopilactobacillus apicola]|uniref:Sugar ABC transporter substrate-binding protein n=1 Tax=Xylocopilactobacillus apicola TaxID=2932184 RepID=A0AAU9D5K3_9LACO|nr:extracellular solute-binding protein [Xylocopilactobacillus apicola]BDR58783.1 sugar ABC transporter substrate-binding protein [Xylocopilactobacillus apicola]
MRLNWKKIFFSLITLMLSLILVGCTGSDNSSKAPKEKSDQVIKGKLKLWVDPNYVAVYTKIAHDFENKYPEVKITIQASNSDQMKRMVSKDPSKAADVFMISNDQIGSMVNSGLIYPLRDRRVDEIKNNNSHNIVEAITFKNNIYGYPVGIDTQVLYYDKSKLSPNDVLHWDQLTSKAAVSLGFTSMNGSYTLTPLFMSNGDQLFGEKGDNVKETNFNNEKGIEVLRWVAQQKTNQRVVDATTGTAQANLENEKIQAWVADSSLKSSFQKQLNNNLSATVLPMVKLSDKELVFKSFLHVKLFGVNQQTKLPQAAMTLAEFLTSKESQLLTFKDQGLTPANQQLQKDPTILNDSVAKSVIKMSDQEHAAVLPKLRQLSAFWPEMDQLLNDTYNGKVQESDYQNQLDELVNKISTIK